MEDKELDNMIYSLVANYITLGKNDKALNLSNFNKKDSRHLAAIHVASLVRDMIGYDLRINTSFMNYLWIKWKFKNIKGIKRTKNFNIDIEEEVKHIEDAYSAPDLFSKIYRTYYRYSDRK